MKNKFLVFALVLVLLFCAVPIDSVFAADDSAYNVTYEEVSVQFEEQLLSHMTEETAATFIYYVDFVYEKTDYYTTKCYLRVYSTEPMLLYNVDGYFIASPDYASSQINHYSVYYVDYENNTEKDGWGFISSYTKFSSQVTYEELLSYVVASNHDIYDESGNLVFQKPSEPLGIPGEILTQVMTQENPLNQILKILPMVIMFLVGCLALRKALATLRATLRKA